MVTGRGGFPLNKVVYIVKLLSGFLFSTIMSAEQTVSLHPIAPRVKGTDGRPKPHIGPSRADYEQHHAKTIGPHSDEWWAKVGLAVGNILCLS